MFFILFMFVFLSLYCIHCLFSLIAWCTLLRVILNINQSINQSINPKHKALGPIYRMSDDIQIKLECKRV